LKTAGGSLYGQQRFNQVMTERPDHYQRVREGPEALPLKVLTHTQQNTTLHNTTLHNTTLHATDATLHKNTLHLNEAGSGWYGVESLRALERKGWLWRE